jgi:hypothetical protein
MRPETREGLCGTAMVFESGHVPGAPAQSDLVFSCGSQQFLDQQPGLLFRGRRRIEIHQSAPDFGVFEGNGAP